MEPPVAAKLAESETPRRALGSVLFGLMRHCLSVALPWLAGDAEQISFSLARRTGDR